MVDRQFHYPWEPMFGEYPTPYIQPYQSKYHNLGMNGYIQPPRTIYPGKRYGMMGDYGPRQQGCYNSNDVYPLDTLVMESQGINPNSKRCGFIRNATKPFGY